ncbi:MAG: phosphoglycerate dehydrogenase [Actinomycetaceae bacterium]|nr:phosphoglycerate dehydrogenase [Actinomycetaceae bacterium]
MARILLLENPHESANKVFEPAGVEVVRIKGALQGKDLIDALQGFDMVGIRSKTNITKEVIEQCPQLRAIGCYCIGTNQVDLDAAAQHGIAVFNAPYSNTRSVVELAVCEMISLTRHLPERNHDMHSNKWLKSASGAHEVRGKTLGIIGYGSIGTQLSVIAEALGMHVIFYDVAEKLAIGNAKRVRSLDELLPQADIVSIHIDGRPSNHGFFGRDEVMKMKKGAILLNLARGFLVDVDAVVERLKDGSLSGAGFDVFPSEPNANGEPFESPLTELNNVILTPHIGGSTLEAQESIGYFVASKMLAYWRKGSTELSVNIPHIESAPSKNSLYRIAWIHRNTPGALAKVNRIFADAGANINTQSLATEGEIGYMVTDISSSLPEDAVATLESSEQNIRVRVLKKDN